MKIKDVPKMKIWIYYKLCELSVMLEYYFKDVEEGVNSEEDEIAIMRLLDSCIKEESENVR